MAHSFSPLVIGVWRRIGILNPPCSKWMHIEVFWQLGNFIADSWWLPMSRSICSLVFFQLIRSHPIFLSKGCKALGFFKLYPKGCGVGMVLGRLWVLALISGTTELTKTPFMFAQGTQSELYYTKKKEKKDTRQVWSRDSGRSQWECTQSF